MNPFKAAARKARGEAVDAAEGGLARSQDLSVVPDVEQFPLERYDPPRGRPKNLGEIITPEAGRRLTGYA